MARRARRGGLGASDSDHLSIAARHINDAWNDLERMPPTCRGGIDVASRALASAERGKAHLASVEDGKLRADNNNLFALANRAGFAAGKTLDFFAGTCNASYGEAGKRPLFNRSGGTVLHRRGKKLH